MSAHKTDAEISSEHTLRPIGEIADDLGLSDNEWQPFGHYIAKVEPEALERRRHRPSRLILVSAITPTTAGEGKTTTSIGLAQGLAKIGESACLSLREPSLGPVLGRKGGGAGGGYSQVAPADRINLHFTGDFHAITSAHNLLAAMVDNHLFFGNKLGIDPRRILWRRVMDMNDRALRHAVVGLGGALEGVPRETGFDITAASEVMAMLCLAEDADDLRRRIDRTLIGLTYKREPVTAASIDASGAMLALLRDALKPNLVQTLEGVPALVHGGPFANIAHGCSSVIATRMAMAFADYAITEAGFGFDLGAEKFFDIKCRGANLDTAAVVLVATVRALKMHGGVAPDDLDRPDPQAVARGLPNLDKHLESILHFTELPIVALNRFENDTEEEIAVVRKHAEVCGAPFAVTDHYARGGDGATDLARAVVENSERQRDPFVPLYDLDSPIEEKVLRIAQRMYGARDVAFTRTAQRDLRLIQRLGLAHLPVCVAKTPSSLSDDPKLKGRPKDFVITVRGLEINAGAGFIVVLTGEIMRMPGLPRRPLAERLDLEGDRIRGLA